MTSGLLLPLPGFLAMRQLPDGRVIGVMPQIYTTRLAVDCDAFQYEYGYCYEHTHEALLALTTWDGQGDPPGPWLKLKGHPDRHDEHGPGMVDYMKRKAP